jgi:hypothetical protein
MAIRRTRGILGDDTSPVADSDIIAAAAICGYAGTRVSKGLMVNFDSEGVRTCGAMVEGESDLVRDAELKKEYVEYRLMEVLGARVAERVGDLVPQGMRITDFAPQKAAFPAIIGGGGDFPKGDLRRLQQDLAQEANAYVLKEAEKPGGIGYTGQGAYVGVMFSPLLKGRFAHCSTTRYTLKTDDEFVNRWHPHDDGSLAMPTASKIGAGGAKRTWGMQTNEDVWTTRVKGREHMPDDEVTPTPGSDIVGYVHGLPAVIVYNTKFADVGVPMEVAYGAATNKLSSCFQCTVYMQAAGYPASSVHLGRGESWLPPYPNRSPYRLGQMMKNAAYEALYSYFRYCRSILTVGLNVLNRHEVAGTHRASLAALEAYLGDKTWGSFCADLLLDASTVHDKDFLKALRAFGVDPALHEAEFKKAYDDGDRIKAPRD